MPFFSDNYEVLREYQSLIENYSGSYPESTYWLDLARSALKSVMFNREEYDMLTPYCSEKHAVELRKAIVEQPESQTIRRTVFFLACFIREATLTRESRTDSEQVVLDAFLGGAQPPGDQDWWTYRVDYLRNVLPTRLIDQQYKGLGQLKADISKLNQDSREGAVALEGRIEGYRAELKKLASEYNFVGLADAFKVLLKSKRTEKWVTFSAVCLLGISAIAIPAMYLISESSLLTRALESNWSPSAVTRLIASLGIEIVLLYYFRVALRAYLLAREQITNIQLRLSLCAFIEGYLEFSARAKESAALKSFETLIFGVLPSSDSSLPATIDGLEQIARIAQSMKSA